MTTDLKIAEIVMNTYRWEDYSDIGEEGGAGMRDMLVALFRDIDAIDPWELTSLIEVRVVPGGQLYPAAIPVAETLLAALSDRSVHGREYLWDLLFWICRGVPADRQPKNLGKRCREIARQGLWLCYAEIGHGATREALSVANVVDRDRRRFRKIARWCAHRGFDIDLSEDFFVEDV